MAPSLLAGFSEESITVMEIWSFGLHTHSPSSSSLLATAVCMYGVW